MTDLSVVERLNILEGNVSVLNDWKHKKDEVQHQIWGELQQKLLFEMSDQRELMQSLNLLAHEVKCEQTKTHSLLIESRTEFFLYRAESNRRFDALESKVDSLASDMAEIKQLLVEKLK